MHIYYMVLPVIIAAVLIAFGVLAIYFAVENEKDRNMLVIIIIGLGSVITGIWIILSTISLWVILIKLIAIIMAAVGLFLITGFPGVAGEYQTEGMSFTGIFIGIIMLLLGVYLVLL